MMISKDVMYEFLANPTRENLMEVLDNHLGEENYWDFKERWPSDINLVKLILAIANSGNGCVVIGVRENPDNTYDPVGIDRFRDKAKLSDSIFRYVPDRLQITFKNYDYAGAAYPEVRGKKFQAIIIESSDKDLPYICEKSGEKIMSGDIYVRSHTKNVRAKYAEVDKLVRRKVKALRLIDSSTTLEEHLQQLKVLYRHHKIYFRNKKSANPD